MFSFFLLLRQRLSKSYDTRPNFHFPLTYLIDQVGLQIQYASGAGLLEWRHFVLAIEHPTSFILASNVDDVFVLPKRCLESEAEVESTRNLIKQHVRSFVRGRGRGVDIAFEKAAIQRVIVDGIEQVIEAAEASEHPEKIVDQSKASLQPQSIALDKNLEIASGRMASPLQAGLAVEIAYQKGEIQTAEQIYFFRNRLPALAPFLYRLLALVAFFIFGHRLRLGYARLLLASSARERSSGHFNITPVCFARSGDLFVCAQADDSKRAIDQPLCFSI